MELNARALMRSPVLRTCALFLLLSTILALRQPDAFRHASLFAEDGSVFFQQAFNDGFLSSLNRPYGGYYSTLSRLVASAALLLPLAWTPALYTLASLLIAAGALVWFSLPQYRHFIKSDLLRAGVVLLMACTPHNTPLLKLSYLQWHLISWLALVSVMSLPGNRFFRALILAGAVLSNVSIALGFVFLPIAAVRFAFSRDREERGFWFLFAAACFFNGLLVFATAPQQPQFEPGPALVAFARCLSIRSIDYAVFGAYLTKKMLASAAPRAIYCLPALVLFFSAYSAFAVWRRLPGSDRPFRIGHLIQKLRLFGATFPARQLTLLYLVAALTFMLVFRSSNVRIPAENVPDRYFFVPSQLVLVGLFGLLDHLRLVRWAGVALGVIFLAGLPSLKVPGWPQPEPFARYAKRIEDAAAETRKDGRVRRVLMPVFPAPWFCSITTAKPALAQPRSYRHVAGKDVAGSVASENHPVLGPITFVGDGWWKSKALGLVYIPTNSTNRVYIDKFGWVEAQGNTSGLVFEDAELGRLRTSISQWPFMYSELLQSWIYYQPGSQNPRYFYNLVNSDNFIAGWFIQ